MCSIGIGQRSQLAGLHVEDPADEAVPFAVVPEDLAVRARPPLQHAPLLPGPGARLAQLDPPVAVGQIDHADLHGLVGLGQAVLEVDLHAQQIPAAGVQLVLVVVAEPVELRPARDGAHRRQRRHRSPWPFHRTSDRRKRASCPGAEPAASVVSAARERTRP